MSDDFNEIEDTTILTKEFAKLLAKETAKTVAKTALVNLAGLALFVGVGMVVVEIKERKAKKNQK